MFSFFRKSKLVTDISWLGVDIHSHILPGIDDGSKQLSESLLYIKNLENLGFEKLIFTPHIFQELYPNTIDTISEALRKVEEGIQGDDYNITISAAAEYMVDYNFQVLDGLMSMPDNHILIEMSYLSETPNIENIVFELQVKGYKIILAHPERYNFYHKDLKRYDRLQEMGCKFQLNLLSVLGYYGKHVQQAAKYLLDHKMYTFAGTDLHHQKHMDLLQRNVENGQLYKLIGNYPFMNGEVFKGL